MVTQRWGQLYARKASLYGSGRALMTPMTFSGGASYRGGGLPGGVRPLRGSNSFSAAAESDIDADGTINYWGMERPNTLGVMTAPAANPGCPIGAVLDLAADPPVAEPLVLAVRSEPDRGGRSPRRMASSALRIGTSGPQ